MSERNDSSQHARPLFIDRTDVSGTARVLDRVPLSGMNGDETGSSYDESWLQCLIHRFPQTLPIGEIEPGLVGATPVCMELPTEVGNVDNLFATPRGDLVLTECKLWRNPEARRKVVGQIIDYAACLASWSYDDLQRAVERGTTPEGERPSGSLYEIIGGEQAMEEPSFVDAVARNLRLGRMLLLIVGDGIREEMERLADYLQRHAGFHFTLGMVELAVHRLPEAGGLVVHPRVLAHTVNIERGIVRIEDGKPIVGAVPTAGMAPGVRRSSISQERFFEELELLDSELPERLKNFLELASEEGAIVEFGQSLLLKWTDSRGNKFNLGCIYPNRDVRTEMANWVASDIGRLDLAHGYLEGLAAMIGGSVRRTPKPTGWYVTADGKRVPAVDQLLDHADEWLDAIRLYTAELERAAEAAGG